MSTTVAQPIKEQASSPADAVKKAARAPQQGVAAERRRIVIVCAVLFTLLGSGILVAMTTDLPTTLLQRASLANPRDGFGIEERNGRIVLPPVKDLCRQISFNNDTGVVIIDSRPCEKAPPPVDKLVPAPEATIRRMDSIRQGFSK